MPQQEAVYYRTRSLIDKPGALAVKVQGKFVNLSALSRITGISKSYLSNIFQGKRNPPLSTAHTIASRLGITLDSLHQEIVFNTVEADKRSIMRSK